MHLRSVPIYLATALNRRKDRPKGLARQTFGRIIQRGPLERLPISIYSKDVGIEEIDRDGV